ncbi:hypothetical protein B0O99DRAFT_38398 [Bisporella sp. PMI_857]|nr:hypothetical protein B0O99DRAFT_38398 [Bisporella sp. PMI_857]
MPTSFEILLVATTILSSSVLAKPVANPTFQDDWPAGYKSICSVAGPATITSYVTLPCSRDYPLLSIAADNLHCQPDNCLRQLEKASTKVAPFCMTYTAGLSTVMSGLPEDVSNCANTAEISSACSCIMATDPPAPTTPPPARATTTAMDCQPDNCLRQLEKASAVVAPFCMTYTTQFNTYTTSLPIDVANCAGDTHAISSACSCIMTATAPPLPSSTLTCPAASTIIQTTIQTTTIMVTISTSITPTFMPTSTALDCQADNCLRALERNFPAIAPFCAVFTKTPHTTTLPGEIVNCEGNPSAISSACSCVMQPTSLPTFAAAGLGPMDVGSTHGTEEGQDWTDDVDGWNHDWNGSSERKSGWGWGWPWAGK